MQFRLFLAPVVTFALLSLPLVAPAASKASVRSPDACFIVFRTVREAARRCPIGVRTTAVHDFWTGKVNGYSCDCARVISDSFAL